MKLTKNKTNFFKIFFIYFFSILWSFIFSSFENISYSDNTLSWVKDYYFITEKVASKIDNYTNNYDLLLKVLDKRINSTKVNEKNYKEVLIYMDLKAYILKQKLDSVSNNAPIWQTKIDIQEKVTDQTKTIEQVKIAVQEKIIEQPKTIEQPKIVEQSKVIEKTLAKTDNRFSICDTWCDYDTTNESIDSVIKTILEKYKSKINIIIKEWTYQLENGININSNDITIEWQGDKSKIIILWSNWKDVIWWKGDNGIIRNITIDADKNNSLVAFSSSDTNNLMMDNLIVKWSKTSFAIFLSWPNHESNLEYTEKKSPYYLYFNNILNTWNKIYNSEIYANNTYDSIVMALSDNAEIKNNIIQWKISYYMSQDWLIQWNKFKSTLSDALYLSWPVKNITVKENDFKNILGSAIVLAAQREHKIPTWLSFENINIVSNNIENINYFGMTLNNMKGWSIKNNIIKGTWWAWIYLQWTPLNPSTLVAVQWNTIENTHQINDEAYSKVWWAGIWLENTDNIDLNSNNISGPAWTLNYWIYSWKNQNKNTILENNKILNSKIKDIFQ
jgi:hypothetical protein